MVPISLVVSDQFANWLPNQSSAIQSWCRSTGFKGEAKRYIKCPDSNGTLAHVVMCLADAKDFWLLGVLGAELPAGEYHIVESPFASQEMMQAFLAWRLGQYRFNRYVKDKRSLPVLRCPDGVNASTVQHIADAIFHVRSWINTPASDMGPAQLAEQAQQIALSFGAQCDIIEGDALLEHGYHAIHTVGRAAVDAPRLIDIRWGNDKHPSLTLVGKGVCFDSGGLDIKPARGMRWMKKDMGGAATALGLAHLIMAEELPIKLRVLLPAVENAIGGNSMRPGDVILTKAGKTVEIGNTDAEGRLIVCEALYAACEEKPDYLIDFATLTGAARVANGPDIVALFCNDDTLAHQLLHTADTVQDPVWRSPLYQPYAEMLHSSVADLHNIGNSPYGGAITAALFLEAFIQKGQRWAHFDLNAWNTRDLPGRPKGGEAMALRAVFQWLLDEVVK